MTTFTISEKTLAALPSMNLAKDEVENIVQLFGLRLLDWRRFTDTQASDWFVAMLHKHAADHIFNALTRVRRLAGRERGFWLVSISVIDPSFSPLLKSPPSWTDAELWRMTFSTFLCDELRKTIQRLNARTMDEALNGQV